VKLPLLHQTGGNIMVKAIILLVAIAGIAAFVMRQRKMDAELSAEFESPAGWPEAAPSANGASAPVSTEPASAS
jgi:hypothetical protein